MEDREARSRESQSPPGAGLVMKFGGTSLADAGRIREVARIVADRTRSRPVVVVSALAGVTESLEGLVRRARRAPPRDELDELAAELAALTARHEAAARDLGLAPDTLEDLLATVRTECGRLGELLRGVALLGECTPRTRDRVLAVGELLSHRLVAAALGPRGVAVDPRDVLATGDRFGRAAADLARTREQAERHLGAAVRAGRIPVTGGFVGATADGSVTTLGRGGSDLSATLLGVALEVEQVQIWTDVDGLMTADPRVVPEARTLASVSFQEASELAYFGARVLHPETIRPAIAGRIPVRVKNTLRPDHPGTTIGASPASPPRPGSVRAVAWKAPIAVVSLESDRMLGAHGFLARVFGVFDRWETAVDVVTTSEVSVSLSVDRFDQLDEIARELRSFAEVAIERHLALVCLVGCELLEHPELLGEVLGLLEGIPLRMFCLGSSDVNLTLVVEAARAEEVVRRLHGRFLEEPLPVRVAAPVGLECAP